MRVVQFAAAVFLAAAPLVANAAPQTTPGDPVTAEDTAPGSVLERTRLIAMDTDHDGQWSRTEWRAGGRTTRDFTRLDADRDGKLTGTEIKADTGRAPANPGKNR